MVMDNDTVFEVEDRLYLNPQTSLNEQTEFINTLRDIQAKNTAEINQNTYNLGSPVTSNIGGLTGSEGLWQAQYQTPQTQATVAGLKAAMQEQAVKLGMQNTLNFWKNRYNQSQRRYNRAASTNPTINPKNPDDNVKEEEPSKSGDIEPSKVASDLANTITTSDDYGNPVIQDITTGEIVGGGQDQYIEGTGLFGIGGYYLPAGYNANEVKREYDYGLNTKGEIGEIINYYDKNGNLFAIWDYENGGWIKR